MKLDLHGFNEIDGLLKLHSFLYQFQNSNYDKCTIITGNGIVIKQMVIDELNDKEYRWNHPTNNNGAITLYKL